VAIEQQLEWARTNGAAAEQVDVLEQALTNGAVTIEQIVDLNSRVEDCLADAGFRVTDVGMEQVQVGSSMTMPGYVAVQPEGMDDVAAGAVMDECSTKFIAYAQSAYMDQPRSQEILYEGYDNPDVRQCLIDRGYDVDEDATGYEINLIASDDIRDHGTDPGFTMCTPSDSPSE
jgi:hypothetical protein